ncbi:hypothetical protein [Neobacillus mesonae]|nr:hypothetical protein [Neobacillus mesonae]
MNNKIVMYQGKKFKVLYQYLSDFCEIQEVEFRFNVELVHKSELTLLEG